MSALRILAFDTSGPHLAAALLVDDVVVASHRIDMAKGQAEALMPFLEARLKEAGLGWSHLSHLAVGIGPGNFTGIRISVAAARGLALSLGIPAVGISGFEIMTDPAHGIGTGAADLVSLPALKGQAYVQFLRYGMRDGAPRIVDPATPPDDLARPNLRVRGYRAEEIARRFSAPAEPGLLVDHAVRIAHVAEWRIARKDTDIPRPAPLYVRAADAATASDPPPVILE